MPCTAWIFTTHAPQRALTAYHDLPHGDLIVAVDGGLEVILAHGLTADLWIGDLDSLSDIGALNSLPEEKIIRLSPIKDETDTEMAIKHLISIGIQEMVIFNDLAGRLDHVLGIIQNLLFAQRQGIKICVESAQQRGFFLFSDTVLEYPENTLLSLVSYSDRAVFAGSKNLAYPLENITLYRHLSRGISNRICASGAEIRLCEGEVFCLITIL